jgi:hypothetical protein
MRKIINLTAAAVVALTAIASTAPAQAGNKGAAFVAGIVGGAILGAAISHVRSSDDDYEPRRRVVVERVPVYVERQDVVICKKVAVEDEDGEIVFKKVCR